MGNGSICVNSKDFINERKFTLQYPSHTKEDQKLFTNNFNNNFFNCTDQNQITFPNYYNN